MSRQLSPFKQQFVVIRDTDGVSLFTGTYAECEQYIKEEQVKKLGNNANDFGIYED